MPQKHLHRACCWSKAQKVVQHEPSHTQSSAAKPWNAAAGRRAQAHGMRCTAAMTAPSCNKGPWQRSVPGEEPGVSPALSRKVAGERTSGGYRERSRRHGDEDAPITESRLFLGCHEVAHFPPTIHAGSVGHGQACNAQLEQIAGTAKIVGSTLSTTSCDSRKATTRARQWKTRGCCPKASTNAEVVVS